MSIARTRPAEALPVPITTTTTVAPPEEEDVAVDKQSRTSDLSDDDIGLDIVSIPDAENRNGELSDDIETHTFGATRIPGLFKYIILRRGGTTTEVSEPVAAQLKSILDALEAQPTMQDVTSSDQYGISDSQDAETDPPARESILHASVASQLAEAPEDKPTTTPRTSLIIEGSTKATTLPFENIGVRLDDDPNVQAAPRDAIDDIEDHLVTDDPLEDIGPTDHYDYGEEYYSDTEPLATPGLPVTLPPTTPSTTTTTTTTPPPTTTTTLTTTTTSAATSATTTTSQASPVVTTVGLARPRRPVRRRKVIVRVRSTTVPVPTTSPEEEPALTTRNVQRRPTTTTTTPRPTTPATRRLTTTTITTTTTTTAKPTTRWNRAHRRTTARTRPTPDPANPLAIRARLRPGSVVEDGFQGITINDYGDLECLEQGVYPHPIECDKYVSCVTIEENIKLWTYKCPAGQLYDDFTGRCLEEDLVECYSSE